MRAIEDRREGRLNLNTTGGSGYNSEYHSPEQAHLFGQTQRRGTPPTHGQTGRTQTPSPMPSSRGTPSPLPSSRGSGRGGAELDDALEGGLVAITVPDAHATPPRDGSGDRGDAVDGGGGGGGGGGGDGRTMVLPMSDLYNAVVEYMDTGTAALQTDGLNLQIHRTNSGGGGSGAAAAEARAARKAVVLACHATPHRSGQAFSARGRTTRPTQRPQRRRS